MSIVAGTNKGTADAGDVRAINSYVSATKETVPAYNLSDAFKNGRTNKNNGLPLLAWETVTAEDGDEFIPVLPDAPFDGEGTESSPYLINSKEDLLKLAEVSNSAKSASVLNSWFRLTADIDFANETFTTSIAVNAPFEGTFDGDGHVIKNITMSKGSETYGGLFSQAKGATFKNLGFENVSMASSWNQAGALVGWAEGITVEECFIRNITTTGTGNSG